MTILDNILAEIDNYHSSLLTKKELIDIVTKVIGVEPSDIIEDNGVILDRSRFSVTSDGKKMTLPKKEFELLHYLISNKNRTIRREEILRTIWGTDVIVGDRTIDVHIRKIRAKINKPNLVTRKCYGYMWIEKN